MMVMTLRQQSPANTQVWLDAVPHIRVLPRLENWIAIERVAGVELERAYYGTYHR